MDLILPFSISNPFPDLAKDAVGSWEWTTGPAVRYIGGLALVSKMFEALDARLDH